MAAILVVNCATVKKPSGATASARTAASAARMDAWRSGNAYRVAP